MRVVVKQGDLLSAALSQAAATGGTVEVESGVYETGAIELRSNTELNLQAGAVIKFVADLSAYPIIDAQWEGVPGGCYSPCVYAKDARNISITGRGTIDGGGAFWWQPFRDGKLANNRPTLIGFHDCENVLIEGVTLKNSPSWTVHPLRCDNVNICNVTIQNPDDSPNTDGINPESCGGVRVANCHIDVGDDCIAIKAGTEDTPIKRACENISITNCTMLRGHGGVVIGSEMSGGIRGVTISNCVFNGTDRGIRIKTRRKRGGRVESVLVSNVYMRDVLCPLVINMRYYCGKGGKEPFVADKAAYPADETTPVIRDIKLQNILVDDCRASAGYVLGLPESPVTGLSLDGYTVRFAENCKSGVPAMAEGVPAMTGQPFYGENLADFITREGEGG